MPTRRSRSGYIQRCVLSGLLAMSGAALLASDEAPEGPGDPRNGRNLYVSKGCIRCHSIWGSAAKRGPNLASVGMGRNLYELCASIWSHWSRMNAVLERDKEVRISLTAAEFRDIISYVYYLNYNAQPGKSDIGAEVFSGKGCMQCHNVHPREGRTRPGRPVYEMRDFQGTVAMAVAVWNHGAPMIQKMTGQKIPWPQFEPHEVTDLVEYIRSQTPASADKRMIIPGDPVRGRDLFASMSCSFCHASSARTSPRAPDLASSGTSISLSALTASLWNHFPRMSQSMAASGAGYPKIKREEMEDILAYVYWLRAFGVAGSPKAGHSLYYSKQCASCHSPATDKPAVAPSLVGSETTTSAYGLMAAIWNHGPRMDALLRERNLPWPALSGEEMRDMVAYFRHGKPTDAAMKR